MKIYLVQEINYEYNDEYYSQTHGGTPRKAFKNKKNAETEAEELNLQYRKNHEYELDNNKLATEFFTVVAVEAEEDEVSYASAVEKVREARKQAQELAKEAFKEEALKLFTKYPELKSFSWDQYTDYFNDGDTCTFSIHAEEYSLHLNGLDCYEEITSGTEYKLVGKNYKTVKVSEPHELYEVSKEVSKMIYSFEQDDMQEMFGDHITVTITKNGNKIEISTENCQHD